MAHESVPASTRFAPSPTPVLIIGGVFLAWSVFLTWQVFIVNALAWTDLSSKSGTGVIFFWVVTLGFLSLGISQIRPRRRFRATTTPAQRVVLKAEAKAEMKHRRRRG
jgi:hypothetical protein